MFFLKKKNEIVYSPLKGNCVEMKDVDDEVFSSGMIGDGLAFDPIDNELCSPVEGIIKSIFPTKHAICMESKMGVEIVLHIGIDTVELNGKYIDVKVLEGSQVKKGDVIAVCDFESIQKSGYQTTTIMVFPNFKQFKMQRLNFNTSVNRNESLFEFQKI